MRKLIFSGFVILLMLTVAACSSSVNKPAPSATAAPSPTATATQKAEQTSGEGTAAEGTEFDVMLVDGGDRLLDVVKAVRDMTSLDLAKSKEIVETVPAKVLERVSKEAAEAARLELEAAGAAVELVPLAEADGELTQYEVVLLDGGAKLLEVVKMIRDHTSLDLSASKEIVDNAPATVVDKASKEEAEALKAVLEEAGAIVEIK